MHCSKFGEADHNAARCKIHPKKKIKTEPKDVGSSPGPEVVSQTQISQTSI
ncbi:hypothetical protein Bca4012_056419 [Brassica carinata]|uniref:Uncharacterized protein n=1 Tax=Brassica carinata TaxID=52824 RepID=A0A8X7W106_BRACI|nr:hypothetical protein Bca52824_013753 [Brassica carinata]